MPVAPALASSAAPLAPLPPPPPSPPPSPPRPPLPEYGTIIDYSSPPPASLPPPSCTPGSVRLELTAAGAGASCASNPLAKCFNSITVATTAACALTVAPNDPGAASDVQVPALFAAASVYTQLAACPAAGDAALAGPFVDATVLADLQAVLASSIWAAPATTLGALTFDSSGVLSGSDSNGGCALTWQAVQSSVSGATGALPRHSGAAALNTDDAMHACCRGCSPRPPTWPPAPLGPRAPPAPPAAPKVASASKSRALPAPRAPCAVRVRAAAHNRRSPLRGAGGNVSSPACDGLFGCRLVRGCRHGVVHRRRRGQGAVNPGRRLRHLFALRPRHVRRRRGHQRLLPLPDQYVSGSAGHAAAAVLRKAAVLVGSSRWICQRSLHAALTLTALSLPAGHLRSYQDSSGKATCKPCPSKSYAHLPGAAACMKCIGGRATACTGTSCNATAPSSGYAVAAVAAAANTLSTCSAWNSGAEAIFGTRPALFATCGVSAATVMSFFVKSTCEVVITPLATTTLTTAGLACSAPGNADATVSGFYIAADTIMSKLSTA